MRYIKKALPESGNILDSGSFLTSSESRSLKETNIDFKVIL